MKLAIFDFDDTLSKGNSGLIWTLYLILPQRQLPSIMRFILVVYNASHQRKIAQVAEQFVRLPALVRRQRWCVSRSGDLCHLNPERTVELCPVRLDHCGRRQREQVRLY